MKNEGIEGALPRNVPGGSFYRLFPTFGADNFGWSDADIDFQDIGGSGMLGAQGTRLGIIL